MASDKALSLWLCKNGFPSTQKIMKQELIGRKKRYMWIHTQVDSDRDTLSWWPEALIWDISSGFPLASHLALPGSESVFVLSQGLPTCTRASVKRPVVGCHHSRLKGSKEPFCAHVVGKVSFSLWEKYVVYGVAKSQTRLNDEARTHTSGQGLAPSPPSSPLQSYLRIKALLDSTCSLAPTPKYLTPLPLIHF